MCNVGKEGKLWALGEFRGDPSATSAEEGEGADGDREGRAGLAVQALPVTQP